ncbi:hypothetical protein E1301_Tti019734 [Triplophysa tibetana]|uniref:Uncharacterized protein n=1 Tax=Triplophysa tibetana TaxID=1572043 RepID=A0A5A9NAG1_9TELE|nr:hypothetical protein E1301_Tti019734 [Triplophysa tibetana]
MELGMLHVGGMWANASETPATDESKQNKESLDMNPLLNKQETDRSEEETQPESMESQT